MINLTVVLPPPHAHDAHSHDYALVLADMETGNGYELNRFEAPCVVTDERANLATIIAALRDTADQLADAHADILAPPTPQCDSVGPSGMLCQMPAGHDGVHACDHVGWPDADDQDPHGHAEDCSGDCTLPGRVSCWEAEAKINEVNG
jgi:hypothetical protein